ncbi:MAG: DMT family transporter [Pseudomonadota bacterium]
MKPPFPLAGEILLLFNALIWAISVLLYRVAGFSVSPVALNLFKGTIGTALFLATLPFFGGFFPTGATAADAWWIFGSGVVGIALADTLFFASLNRLGAARSAIVDCLYSPFIILFAYLILGEKLTLLASIGALLIVSGVFLSSFDTIEHEISREDFWRGTAYGALSMAFMGIAIVVIKPILGNYPILWSATLRMGGGTVGMILYALLHPKRREIWSIFRPQPSWKVLVPGSVLGGYLAFLVWLGGFKYAPANIAGLLTQLSSVFVVALAVWILKERLTKWKAIALVLAIGGTVLVLL